MKKVIYIKAPSNRGKTEIIVDVYQKFLDDKWESDQEFKKKEADAGNKKKDICDVLMKGNVKIGFSSCGDPSGGDLHNSQHTKWLKALKKQKCNLILCACRTRGETLDSIKNIFKDEDKFGFIPHYNSQHNNTHNANLVFNMMLYLL